MIDESHQAYAKGKVTRIIIGRVGRECTYGYKLRIGPSHSFGSLYSHNNSKSAFWKSTWTSICVTEWVFYYLDKKSPSIMKDSYEESSIAAGHIIGSNAPLYITLLGEYIVASQNNLECLDVRCELFVDEYFVRTLRRRDMRFLTLERYNATAAVEDPSRGPKRCAMMNLLSVQHDRPALAEVKFDHTLGSPTANLEFDAFFQVVQT